MVKNAFGAKRLASNMQTLIGYSVSPHDASEKIIADSKDLLRWFRYFEPDDALGEGDKKWETYQVKLERLLKQYKDLENKRDTAAGSEHASDEGKSVLQELEVSSDKVLQGMREIVPIAQKYLEKLLQHQGDFISKAKVVLNDLSSIELEVSKDVSVKQNSGILEDLQRNKNKLNVLIQSYEDLQNQINLESTRDAGDIDRDAMCVLEEHSNNSIHSIRLHLTDALESMEYVKLILEQEALWQAQLDSIDGVSPEVRYAKETQEALLEAKPVITSGALETLKGGEERKSSLDDKQLVIQTSLESQSSKPNLTQLLTGVEDFLHNYEDVARDNLNEGDEKSQGYKTHAQYSLSKQKCFYSVVALVAALGSVVLFATVASGIVDTEQAIKFSLIPLGAMFLVSAVVVTSFSIVKSKISDVTLANSLPSVEKFRGLKFYC